MAVCSILYQLATRPEEQEKLYHELRTVLPDPTVPLTSKHLDQMYYLKAFVREVFRMYSTVIGNGRTLQQDMIIGGYQIPKGVRINYITLKFSLFYLIMNFFLQVQIVFPTLVTGNMEEYVTKAHEFLPERWLKHTASEIKYNFHPFSSLPYGHGARMCLGRRFADLEIQVLLAKLLRSYKLEFLHEPLSYKVTFMYAPDGDLKFKVTERNS